MQTEFKEVLLNTYIYHFLKCFKTQKAKAHHIWDFFGWWYKTLSTVMKAEGGLGSVRLRVGLKDLEGLFQPKSFYNRFAKSNQCDCFLLYHSQIFLNMKTIYALSKTYPNQTMFLDIRKIFLAKCLKTLKGKSMFSAIPTCLKVTYFTSNFHRRRRILPVKSCSNF